MDRDEDPPAPQVGVVGLGAMGSAIAHRLLDRGMPVRGFDMDARTRARCAEWGLAVADTLAGATGDAGVIITCLPDGGDVEAAVLGPGGVAESAAAGSLLLECSTIDPAVTRRVAERLRGRGVLAADAAIGRSIEHVRRGEAALMVGAGDEAYRRALPVLSALASDVTRCGDVGAGVTMKLVNNLLAATILAADVEALALATKAGLDPETVVATLTATAARNAILEDKIPREVLAGGPRSDFKVRLAHKDVGHAQNLAARLGVPLFALAPVRQLYGVAIAQGRGEEPTACLADLYEEWTDVTLAGETA